MSYKIRRTILITLFIYSLIFTLVLVFGAFTQGISFSSIITTLLIFPVLYHFFSELIRINQKFLSIKDENLQPTYIFKFKSFFTQKDPTFAITLILLTITLSLTLLKATNIISSPNIASL